MGYKTHTYTAKLSPAVHERLTTFLEPQRLLYHAGLEERLGADRKAGVSVSLYDQYKSLTVLRADPEFSQYALKGQRSCLFTLDRAFKAFFRRVKAGQKPGFPRFKGRDRGMRSFSTSQPRLKQHGKWHARSIKGIGRLRFKGQADGTVVKVRVVQTPLRVCGQLVVELPDTQPPFSLPLGIDVGIAARITLSDGQRWTTNAVDRERLTVLQQRLAAAKKGAKMRQKRKRMLAKEWQRVRDRERAIRHEMPADLIKKTKCYYVEDLPVQNMLGNRHLARSIAEQQWSTFVQMLTD